MEYGFLYYTTNKETIRLPIQKFLNKTSIFISHYDNGTFTQWEEVPFILDEENDKKTISIGKVTGPFFWMMAHSINEIKYSKNIDFIKMPERYYYIYDIRTSLIHCITDRGVQCSDLEYDANYKMIQAKKLYDPFKYGIQRNKFKNVDKSVKETWYKTGNYYKKTGIITSWNVPCGIAEYVKQLQPYFNFPYIILAKEANDLINKDQENVKRCFNRDNWNKLKETIKTEKIDNIWLHYSYSFFTNEVLTDFLLWCKVEKIRVVAFAHSVIEKEHLNLLNTIYNGNDVSIAPVDFNNINIQPNKYKIGAFGFAVPHKCFEKVFNFIKENKKYHYYIWTNFGQGGKNIEKICNDYLYFLYKRIEELDIKNRVHINIGFIEEEELLKNLASCQVLIAAYDDIPNENQSAAIALMRASGRPIVTSLSSKLTNFADFSVDDIGEGINEICSNISKYETIAKGKKYLYTKKDEFFQHLKYLKPYGDIGVLWRGDLHGVKSFSVVNRNFLKILHKWGIRCSLKPDNVEFNINNEPEYISDFYRTQQTEDMLSTGIHYPPLFTYCDAPIGAWETDKCPVQWEKSITDKMKKVIVISNFVKQAFIRGGIDKKYIEVIQLGINDFYLQYEKKNIYNVSSILEKKERPFTFTNVSWPEPRKGTDVLIDAFCQEFTKKDNVVLLLKATGQNNWVDAAIKHYKNKYPNSPNIILIDEVVENLSDIYMATDVYVHPLRGEGFGLPVLEAAGYAIPSIVTKYAGPLDFTNDKTCWYLDYKLKLADYQHKVEGARWAEPNLIHLRKLMRYTFNHPNEVKTKGLNAFLLATNFTWEEAAYKLIDVLCKIKNENTKQLS